MKDYKSAFDALFKEIDKVIVGQDEVLKQVLICILCDANALLEGAPGLAKTLAVKTLSELMELKFSRIQSTPDLMPSDITGTYIIEERGGKREFKFQEGPIFANIVLADEINRATPKTQSAMLEAMQEKQVSVGNTTFQLDKPFFVLATQNPIEQEGSLSLKESVFVNGMLKNGHELLQIGELIAEDEKGIKLYDLNAWTYSLNTSGRLEKKECYLYTLPYDEEMVSVTTKTGKNITVTKNHPFLVNDRGIIQWKKAEDLCSDDYLINPASIKNIPAISIKSHKETIAKMHGKAIPCEIKLDEDFIFWISFLLSDGSIGEKYVEAVQKNYPLALDRFEAISHKYGFKTSSRYKDGCRHVKIYSKPLVEYLKIRFDIKTGKDKEIPQLFLSLPAELNKEFLRTFISLESSLRDNRITFTQKSKNNVNMISYMLLREGIISWIRHDGRIFRLKIQGKDTITYIKNVGWISKEKESLIDTDREIRSSFRVIPVDRKTVMSAVKFLGIDSFHTLKERKKLTERNWYVSYKGIKEGENVMAVESLRQMVVDLKAEITKRKDPKFIDTLRSDPRTFSASIGLPMTQISEELNISNNQVWNLYSKGVCVQKLKIEDFILQKFSLRVEEVGKILNYLEQLLSEDIFYDRIKKVSNVPGEGFAFGLTVPDLQNYIGGFGGCGINHNTYPLPEAQQDRFLLKILVDYPSYEDEMKIVNIYTETVKPLKLKPMLNKAHILSLQELVRQVPIANDIKQRVVRIVQATRANKDIIHYGASPRASIGLILAAKAAALIEGRAHVSMADIEKIAYPVLRHRIILNFEAERKGMSTDDAVKEILKKVK